MIEKIKAFFRKAKEAVKGFVSQVVTVAKEAVLYNYPAIVGGAGLALFGSGWNEAFGFIGASIVGVYAVERIDIEEMDLPADLAVVIGAGIGAGLAALVRLLLGGM